MFLGLGVLEFVIIVFVTLLLFAPRLGKLGKGFSEARREFKRTASGDANGESEKRKPSSSEQPAPHPTDTSATASRKSASGKGHHRIVRVLVGVVAAMGIAWVALVVASNAVWGRSAMATLSEWYLAAAGTERIFAGGQATADYLAERAAVEDDPYEVPGNVRFSVSVAQTDFEGMQVFRMNGESDTGKAVLYIHGGAYVNEIGTSHWSFLDAVASQSGAQVVVPLYKLAPNHTYDEVWPSMLSLYRSVAEEFGADNVTLMGDSAGGGFAAALAEDLAQRGEQQPGQLVLLSPWVDISCASPEMADYEGADPMLSAPGLADMGRAWAGAAWNDDPTQMDWRLSPLNGDLSGLRNVHVYVGTREIFYPDVTAFVQKAEEAGVACELVVGQGLNHVWPVYPTPEASAAQADIAAIVAG